MAAAFSRKGDVVSALSNIKKAVKIGGKEIINSLRKDEDKDFYNLYDNPIYKKICQYKVKEVKSKTKKT